MAPAIRGILKAQGDDGMLVISRNKNQSVIIGDDIKITVVEVRGDKVRLGISAPREVSVHRVEVYEAIQREKSDGKGDRNRPDSVSA